MGLPAIVTDINGCNEIILPNKNGLIIPSRNEEALYQAMEYCFTHLDIVRHMALESRALILSRYEQRYVWKALLEEKTKTCNMDLLGFLTLDYLSKLAIMCKELAQITTQSKFYHFCDYTSAFLLHGCSLNQYSSGKFYA